MYPPLGMRRKYNLPAVSPQVVPWTSSVFPASAATVTPLDGGAVRVDFDEPQRAITAGQAVVFYRGATVAGGATIGKAL